MLGDLWYHNGRTRLSGSTIQEPVRGRAMEYTACASMRSQHDGSVIIQDN